MSKFGAKVKIEIRLATTKRFNVNVENVNKNDTLIELTKNGYVSTIIISLVNIANRSFSMLSLFKSIFLFSNRINGNDFVLAHSQLRVFCVCHM